jgi:hypothetical protein
LDCFKIAVAMHSSCRCPCEKLNPPSLTVVQAQSGLSHFRMLRSTLWRLDSPEYSSKGSKLDLNVPEKRNRS